MLNGSDESDKSIYDSTIKILTLNTLNFDN